MELAQLNYFCETARHATFSQAAQALHITQPALSKSVAKLERELGCHLFERGAGPLRLTSQGRAFLHWTRQALSALDSGMREVRDLGDQLTGAVRIAISEGVFLKHLIRDFLVANPEVDLACVTLDSERIAALLASGELDFAVTRGPVFGPDVFWHPVYTDRVAALMSREHPLAGRACLNMEELAEESFIVGDLAGDSGSHTLELCYGAGFTPRIRYQGHESDVGSLLTSIPRSVLLAYHSTTLGVGRWGRHPEAIITVPISDNKLPEELLGLGLRASRYQTAAARAFYDLVTAYFHELSAPEGGQSGSLAP